MLDSGCTQHMTGYVKMFTSLDEDVGDYEHVTFGDNSKGKVVGLGKVAITKDLSISNVLLVESVSFNLLSIAQLCDLGLICTFSDQEVVVTCKENKSLIFKGFRHGNIYLVDFSSNDVSLATCLFSNNSMGWLWHRRIAHIGSRRPSNEVWWLVSKMLLLTKINCVVLVKPGSNLYHHIP